MLKQRSLYLLVLFLCSAPFLHANLYYVDDDAPAGGDGSSWLQAFQDLQDALDAAVASDIIKVGAGHYKPSARLNPSDPRTATFQMKEDVAIIGGYAGYALPSNPDTWDVEKYVSVLNGDVNGDDQPGFVNRTDNCEHLVYNEDNGLTSVSILMGFTIYGGFSSTEGAGIYCKGVSPSIANCTFSSNMATNGAAGMYCENGSPAVLDCTFKQNWSNGPGGGLMIKNGSPLVRDCLFTLNQAYSGAGIQCTDNAGPKVKRCTFSKNIVIDNGGGISCVNGGTPEITDCEFIENDSLGGGGYASGFDVHAVFVNCLFVRNHAGLFGGALYIVQNSKASITNCTLFENTANQMADGIMVYSSAICQVTNSILWRNGLMELFVDPGSILSVTYSDVKGGWPGNGNIDSLPYFMNPSIEDFHLTYDSPCRDTGIGSAPNLPDYDIEGDPRIAYGAPDMGYDEFHDHFYCTGDFTPGGDIKGRIVGLPGTTPLWLIFGSNIRLLPLNTAYGAFYLFGPYVFVHLPLVIPSNGVLVLTTTIPATPAAPYSVPMQALIGSNLSNPYILKVE